MLQIMVVSCAEEMSRPVLTGVHCKDGAMASADGFRLTVLNDARLTFGLGEKDVIIPATTANLVRRLFGKEDKVEIAFGIGHAGFDNKEAVNKVYFRSGSVWMASEIIQGNYPKYEQLIPKEYTTKVSFSAPVMAQRLGMIDEKSLYSGITRFNFYQKDNGEQECSLKAGNEDIGQYALTMPVKLESPEGGKIAFNLAYIQALLKFFSMVDLEITTNSSPGKFTGDIEGLSVTVMPMFVQWD